MNRMFSLLRGSRLHYLVLLLAAGPLLQSCGGTSIGNPMVTVQTNPLAGPNAAFLRRSPLDTLTNGLMYALFGVRNSYATVSSFNKFQICLEYITFERTDGSFQTQNGTPNVPINPGLITFSPTDTSPKVLGGLDMDPGSTLLNVKFAIATVPSLCQGATYGVLFNGPTSGGDIFITQNVAFRFDFAPPGLFVTGAGQTLDLLLGQIVNGMVALGSGLNNQTIQTVTVGQAH